MIRLITILILLSLKCTAATYYVKVAGGTGSGADDANAWSYAKLNATSLSSGDIVLFKRGESFYGALIARAGVTYDTYSSGSQPIITGFTSLTSWSNSGGNIWTHSLSAGSVERMVTIGGVIEGPGRFPNTGWLPIVTGGSSSLTTSTSSPSTYSGGDIVIRKTEWIIDRCAISSISGSTINFTNVDGFPALSPEGPNPWGFFFTNHTATLDTLHEWYYTSGTLTMYSTTNPNSLNVKAASVSELVNMSSKDNITFRNLTFEGTTGNIFSISGGDGNLIENCTIRYAGLKGIDANFGTHFTVRNCQVNNTNYSGVDAILGSYQYISKNTFTNIGLIPSLCQPNNKANHAIWVNGTHNKIDSNDISYTGYVGIDFSGDYDTVINNYVTQHCRMVTDGGGIYMSDETNGVGRVIQNNVVTYGYGPRDGTPYSGLDNALGIYLDESSAGVAVINNFSAFNNGGGIYLHKAHDCIVMYNTFYANTLRQAYFNEDADNDTRIHNIRFSNNYLYAPTSSDYVYALRGTPTIDTFFAKINDNVIAKPSSTSNIVYRLNKIVTERDSTGNATDFSYEEQYYSLSGWRSAYPSYDGRSTGTPSDFASGTPIVLTSYATSLPFTLNGVYKTLPGLTFGAGAILTRPYRGEVLIKTTDLQTKVALTKVLKGKYLFR